MEFTIKKAKPDIGTVSAEELNDTLDVSKVQLSRTIETVSGTLSLGEGTTLQYGTNEYTYVFTPTGNDAVNYEPVEGKVNITVNDKIAPTAKYQIGVDGWKQFVNTISLNAKGVYFIYVKVEDNAGNIAILNSEGIVIYMNQLIHQLLQ